MVENQNIQFWIEDGILHGLYKKNCMVTLEAAKEIVKLRLSMQGDKTYPCIAYLLEGEGVFKSDARKFLAIDGYIGVEKLAIITTSSVKAVIANVFITIDKPIKPTRLFTSKQKALLWLKS